MKEYLFILVLILLSVGCADFLEEESLDEVRPSTVSDLEQLLLGDGYEDAYNFYYCSEIFTDNMMSNGISATSDMKEHDFQKWRYIWDEDMFDEAGGGKDVSIWKYPYEGILGCNLVLDNLDKMGGDDELREYLRGEALTLRGWYYLHLVNFFGVAYNQGDPVRELGVPLKLDASVTGEFFTRNTVAEIYAQIEKDLLEGNRLLKQYDMNRNYFRMGHLAAKAILSRVYLYMEEWDKALAYADSVLNVRSELLDLNGLARPIVINSQITGGVYDPTTSTEIIWCRKNVNPEVPLTKGPFNISEDLGGIYEKGSDADYVSGEIRDLRAFFYFGWVMDTKTFPYANVRQTSRKAQGDQGGYQGIRVSELYLNRAEAYCQKFLEEKDGSFRQRALDDLNELRRHRYNEDFPYVDIDIADGQTLLDFCLQERRKELVGEANHRWCDLRRYGKTIEHVLIENGEQTYTKDMGKYVLPIPEEILRLNPDLVQNK